MKDENYSALSIELAKLTINYSTDDITQKYRNLAGRVNINKYIGYTEEIRREGGYANGTFHFVLSIKVSDKSTFVPFVFGLGESNGKSVNNIARDIQTNSGINYTFSEFVLDVANKENGGLDIPRVSFKTHCDDSKGFSVVEGRLFNKKDSTGQKQWFEPSDEDKQNIDFFPMLCPEGDRKTFAYVMSEDWYKNELNIDDLYFTIISIDSSFNNIGRLSNFMVISSNKDEASYFIGKSLEKIREIISLIRTRYVYDLLQKNKHEATKSAKAAIMSRNMSHNIGSHVMSYLKQKMGSITAIMSDENKVLYNLTDYFSFPDLQMKNGHTHSSTNNLQPTTNANKLQFPFLVGTGRFIGYLQERQDYIATIATDYIPYGAPVNLKDAIYDELNPDLRYMRHQNDDGNRPMNVLLSFIAKSEGLSRENMNVTDKTFKTEKDILFGFPKYEDDGAPHVFGILPKDSGSNDEALTEMRKINFSLPGGLVGRQAIFSVVENLIRNAAKHGKPGESASGNLELTFDVIDLADMGSCKQIRKRICDEKWRTLYEHASDHEQLYLFSITDNLIYNPDTKGETLAQKLRPALTEDYLDERGNMSPTNKGIKEIRISAAWMRDEVNEDCYFKYDDEPSLNKKAPLVAIEMTEDNHLRYMICLPQDRLAAVILDGMDEADKTMFKKLHERSSKDWTLYDNVEEAKANGKISYHYMLVSPGKYNDLRPYTSNRLFVWSPTDGQRLALGQDPIDEVQYASIKNAIIRILHQITDKSESIYIWDSKAYGEQKEREQEGEPCYEKVKLSEKDDNAANAQYVYRTHHSTAEHFKTYWKDRSKSKNSQSGVYGKVVCIESITGDNSSDRIVRREPLNEEWYCSHLRAMKKRVAIFDERLFTIVHNVDENKFVQGSSNEKIDAMVKQLKENPASFELVKEYIRKENLLKEDTSEILIYADTPDDLKSDLEQYIKNHNMVFNPQEGDSRNYKSIVYQEKGVDVFTIVREGKGSFAIIGYVGCSSSANGDLEMTRYDKVASITCVAKPFSVKFDFCRNEFAKQYDYISIHQGILDKIYEEFGIKEHGEENDPKKCQVTKSLHEAFIKEDQFKPIGDFLPCFIIHSGRAKPTKNDMPQELPFVQYAAIEHGVLDCKYSLVELLDYARYEK